MTVMRNYGINYDTGLTADGHSTRKSFDDTVVQRELQIITSDLHATAVRVTGDNPQRLARAGEHALAAGEEARAPQRDLASEHEHYPALMCRPEPFGLVCAAGKVPGQCSGFKVDRDRREPQLQPGV